MAKDDEMDDGFVSMAEISAEDFDADLVVVSACNTGRGFELRGEGNMSLARTFLAQGVDSVVSTLWPVSDPATALFMKEFYRALNEDKRTLAESLQSAQRVLRESGRYRHAFFWSGYVLTTAARLPSTEPAFETSGPLEDLLTTTSSGWRGEGIVAAVSAHAVTRAGGKRCFCLMIPSGLWSCGAALDGSSRNASTKARAVRLSASSRSSFVRYSMLSGVLLASTT